MKKGIEKLGCISIVFMIVVLISILLNGCAGESQPTSKPVTINEGGNTSGDLVVTLSGDSPESNNEFLAVSIGEPEAEPTERTAPDYVVVQLEGVYDFGSGFGMMGEKLVRMKQTVVFSKAKTTICLDTLSVGGQQGQLKPGTCSFDPTKQSQLPHILSAASRAGEVSRVEIIEVP